MIIAAITAAILFFASGSSRACDLRGFAEINMAAGIALPQVSEETLAEIEGPYKASGLPLFVDSGAFSEVKFGPAGPYVVEPISHEMWLDKLAVYKRIAVALGERAYLVAPDKVAFPADTLARLRRYRGQLQELAATGAKLLIAMQGPKDQLAAFCHQALEAAGLSLSQVVVAFPCCKNATTAADLELFLNSVQPAAIHLLGLGPKAKALKEMTEVINELAPACKVSHDACYIRRHVGTKPRPAALTAAKHAWEREAESMLWSEFEGGNMGEARGDWTELISEPGLWLTTAAKERVAKAVGMSREEKARWMENGAAWLQEGGEIANYELPWVEAALNAEWIARHNKVLGREKQRQGIVEAFGPHTELHVPVPASWLATPPAPAPASNPVQLSLF